MFIQKRPDLTEKDVTDPILFKERRTFLRSLSQAGLAMTAGILTSKLTGCSHEMAQSAESQTQPLKDVAKSPLSVDEPPTSKDLVTGYVNYYEFGTDKSTPVKAAQDLKISPWSVVVEGECNKPGTYTLEDILKPHPLEERIYRFRCVETWSAVVPWIGFSLGDLLKRFEPTGNAKFVQFQTLMDPAQMPGQHARVLDWPYVEGLRMDEAMHPLALIAVGEYGETLPKQNGAPLRLVVPWKYGFKSIKAIVKIRFVEPMPDCSWNSAVPNEYGFYSNVNPEVPHPRWSQAKEQRLGELRKRDSQKFNGYGEQVASLYAGMDLKKYF